MIRYRPEFFSASLTAYERSGFYLNRFFLNSDFGPGTADSGSALDVSGSIFRFRRGRGFHLFLKRSVSLSGSETQAPIDSW